jgi:hypothetical protein
VGAEDAAQVVAGVLAEILATSELPVAETPNEKMISEI